jgi:hypothetical protein
MSWVVDLPSGPAVIVLYAIALIVAVAVLYVARADRPKRAAVTLTVATTLTAIVASAIWAAGRVLASTSLAISEQASHTAEDVTHEAASAESRNARQASQRRSLLLKNLGQCAAEEAVDRYLSLAGPEERLAPVRQALPNNRHEALGLLLISLADNELPLLYREEGKELLEQTTGQSFGYDSEVDAHGNLTALERVCEHLVQQADLRPGQRRGRRTRRRLRGKVVR